MPTRNCIGIRPDKTSPVLHCIAARMWHVSEGPAAMPIHHRLSALHGSRPPCGRTLPTRLATPPCGGAATTRAAHGSHHMPPHAIATAVRLPLACRRPDNPLRAPAWLAWPCSRVADTGQAHAQRPACWRLHTSLPRPRASVALSACNGWLHGAWGHRAAAAARGTTGFIAVGRRQTTTTEHRGKEGKESLRDWARVLAVKA